MLGRRRSLIRYIAPSSDPFNHFKISRGPTQRGFANLPCLLARAWADGNFELVNPAWRVLGYSKNELAGRSLCELIALHAEAAHAAVTSLLTEGRSLQFGLRCKNGGEMRFHWNRQFDDFSTSMFIIGDDLPAARPGLTLSLPRTKDPGIRGLSLRG